MDELNKLGLDPQAVQDMPETAKRAREIAMKSLGTALLRVNGKKSTPGMLLRDGQRLRDSVLWEFPILPGAVSVFQQLVSGREWVVSGKPRSVSRMVEWVNNAQVVDRQTGIVYYGFENFLKRHTLDYLAVGRTSFVVDSTKRDPVLEYIDPTYLKFERKNQKDLSPVKPDEQVWTYDDRHFKAKDMVIDHPLPFATNLFIAPLTPIIPTATLAWLIREHHTASVDGRKIRDIIFVQNAAMKNAMHNAINSVAALWAGESVEKVGLPVVEINNASGTPVSDMFAMLGISRMPENFKEEEFWFLYVNEIAGNLALALRHFWNSERTTNKALEEVQERRGQMKGPATCVRSIQRGMNRPVVTDQFSSGVGKGPRMGFVEETDASAKLDNAAVLEKTTRALAMVSKVFGANISPDAYLAWMQSLGALPNELELIESDPNKNKVQESDSAQTGDPDDTTMESDPQPNALDSVTAKYLSDHRYFIDYDEVSMNGQGQIVDRRHKVFTVAKVLSAQILAEEKPTPKAETAAEAMARGIEAMSTANRVLFKKFWPQIESEVKQWSKTQFSFKKRDVSDATQACLGDQPLTEHQQLIVDDIVGRFIDEPVGEAE